MSGIGERLREERERLGLSQRAFGEIGGVKPNAQGNYESGERTPPGDYLEAISASGVDVLYVLTGRHTPSAADALTAAEADVLDNFRALSEEDQASVVRLTKALATSVGAKPKNQ